MRRLLPAVLLLVPVAAGAQQAAAPARPQAQAQAQAQAQPAALPGATLPGIARAKPVSAPGEVSHDAPVNGILTLYGNQRCPTDQSGNEIVVCRRRSASEQYRVPKDLREFKVTPENESWATKVAAERDPSLGANAIGSCSVVGPGGQSGCFQKQARVARGEQHDRIVEDRNIP